MKLAILVLAGIGYGVFAGELFRRFVQRDQFRVALNRITAHVLEFGLFANEPLLVFRAQRDLLLANLSLMRCMAGPLLGAGLLFAAAYIPMDRYFAIADPVAGEVTLARVASVDAALDLLAPFGVAIESPPLRIERENATYWRVRTIAPVNGEFRTLPSSLPVTLRSRPVQFLGVGWVAVFAIISTIAAAATQLRFSTRTLISRYISSL